jgi:hypothetical protein
MTTSSVNSSSWLNPAQQLLEFLNALPSPFREQLLYRLYGFFYDEIYHCFLCGDDPDETLSMIVTPYSDYLNFQRAILIIGALDYLFSQKSPWPRIVEAYPEIELEGMKGAFFPVRDEPYLEARQKWKKLRSKLSYFILRRIDEKVSLALQQGHGWWADIAIDPQSGEWIRTFAIVTVPANDLVVQIHDRMPLILPKVANKRWLGIEPDPYDLLTPFPEDLMMMWPVSARLNSPDNDDSSLLEQQREPTTWHQVRPQRE